MERLWLVGERINPGFFIELVLEGEGLPLPREGWLPLLERLALAVPAVRGRLRGVLGGCRWSLDGPLPELRTVDLLGWPGASDTSPWPSPPPVDPRRGPLVQLFLGGGPPDRVVLRVHHALMDGRGLLHLGRVLFALLRGEGLAPDRTPGPTDRRVARRLPGSASPPPERDCVAIGAGPTHPSRPGTTWRRLAFAGNPSAVLARTLVALARALPPEGPARVDLPVDLRRYLAADEGPSTANLTGIVRLDLRPVLAEPDPVRAVKLALTAALERGEAAGTVRAADVARWLPVGLMAAIGRGDARAALAQGRFGASALVSNFGQVALADFSGGGFRAQRAFVVPPSHPGLPLFLSLLGTQERVEMCAVVPRAMAGCLDSVEPALRAEFGPPLPSTHTLSLLAR